MTDEQRDKVVELIQGLPGADAARSGPGGVRAGSPRPAFGDIHFAWAGSAAPGEPHYYRIHGPTFLIEYDNTQNGANHIHSVWRDLTGDFGRDLLARALRGRARALSSRAA